MSTAGATLTRPALRAGPYKNDIYKNDIEGSIEGSPATASRPVNYKINELSTSNSAILTIFVKL